MYEYRLHILVTWAVVHHESVYLAVVSGLFGVFERHRRKHNRQTRAPRVAVLAGVLSMMLALGGVIALLAVPIGRVLAILIPLANLTLLILGILLLLNRNPFTSLPQVRMPVLQYPLANAYLYGLLYGPIALPCSGPLLVSIFAISFTLAEAFDKLWVFLWFGLGFGIPLLIVALLSTVFQRRITAFFARNHRLINSVSGLLLIGIAILDLFQNWAMLQLYYF